MATVLKEISQPKAKRLPAPNSDFYDVRSTLPPEEQRILERVREFADTKVAPIISKYWLEDAFPFELLSALKELNIGGVGIEGYGGSGGSLALFGSIGMELARVDPSIATFFGVHTGLAMGSIYLGGSEDQKRTWTH
jgi:alkylation response protein AidB-like acyl-CoA dehydrogenase